MERNAIIAHSAAPEAIERSVVYLAQNMAKFLKKGETVLICFDCGEHSLGSLFCEAVSRCGAKPLVWGEDRRWNTLLRTAFLHKIRTIIAPPVLVLGMMKLSRHKSTPLSVRNVITAGAVCPGWMIDGFIKGLDCQTWGCLDWKESCVVAGFSCGNHKGVHLRSDVFGVKILDADGNVLPQGQMGQVCLHYLDRPDELLRLTDRGRVVSGPCSCGCWAPRLIDSTSGLTQEETLQSKVDQILRWTSVLDCKMVRTDNGLELELVVFPGEKLPKLPSCARLILRPWDPECDVPFCAATGEK